ncbi:MAG: hypothetical protein AB7P76_02855 [Candidatus Melainabacteria bacterium]
MASQQPPSAQTPGVSVLIFLRSLATPVVLYAENPTQLYTEMQQLIKQASPAAPKLIEKPGQGPLKRVCFLDTEVCGVALQTDPMMPAR